MIYVNRFTGQLVDRDAKDTVLQKCSVNEPMQELVVFRNQSGEKRACTASEFAQQFTAIEDFQIKTRDKAKGDAKFSLDQKGQLQLTTDGYYPYMAGNILDQQALKTLLSRLSTAFGS